MNSPMTFDAIRRYWDDRAAADSSAQSTTQDIYLREIEATVLARKIGEHSPGVVADVGCGDGRTTARLAAAYPGTSFLGLDYAPSMVENARSVNAPVGLENVSFELADVSHGLKDSFNLIYTTRCLINLPNWDFQKIAIRNIWSALSIDGIYLMVENFVEGQANLNQIRKQFDLPEISIRAHNCFFDRRRLLEYVDNLFTVEEEVNISSTYYLVSRVIYSKICAAAGVAPDYLDPHHSLAADLPFCGEFGPVRLVCLRKR